MALIPSMAEALRLTRSGDLLGATRLVRGVMTGEAAPAASPARPATRVIDVTPGRTAAKADPVSTRTPNSVGSFEARTHRSPAGSIDYMLYRPAGARPAMPLVVMLHGCTQSPEDFARGTRMNQLADEYGCLVAYPRQTQSANMQKCWNWFQPGNQQRDRGEPALIAGVVRDIVDQEQADATRVYAAGLSAGGAAAAIMADAYPDVFAAIGVHSGIACGAARDLPSALSAMKNGKQGATTRHAGATARFVPVITFHGDRDTTVGEVNARDIVKAATAATTVKDPVTVETGSAKGRSYSRALTRDAHGVVVIEQWTIAGAGHAWSGGDAAGSYADAAGPDASRAMLDFFLTHKRSGS
jgi:poly(hydroxyalkanoate) depolymerase family esterase